MKIKIPVKNLALMFFIYIAFESWKVVSCICICFCMYTCAHVCLVMWRPEFDADTDTFSSIVLSSLFCETGFLNEVAVWLDWLAKKHRDLPYLPVSTPSAPHHPSARHYAQLFMWILCSRLRSFCFPCCLPCPGLCF